MEIGDKTMCEICGFYGFEDKNVLKRMVKILVHRGPDDNGLYTGENISLWHARLSIIYFTPSQIELFQTSETVA